MKKTVLLMVLSCLVFAGVASAQHYQLGSAWVAGQYGTYIIVDYDGNHVLVGAALDDGDPKHAWVDQDFGNDYTLSCDVRMDTWIDEDDYSRAGIGVRIQPDGTAADGAGDRGMNLLLHNNVNTVQFLNDLRAWGPAETFAWDPRVWYRFVITVSGNTISGSITNLGDPADTIELAPWDFPDPQNRQGGYVGITPSSKPGLVALYDNFEVTDPSGNVLFSDDFEGTDPAPSAYGTSSDWVAGQAGYYVVHDGQLFAIATNPVDPKHLWYSEELVGGGGMTADVTMLSWEEIPATHDHSRAGIALHVQPNGTAPDGAGDRAINLLYHQDLGRVQFLNDLRAWGPQEAIDWSVGSMDQFVIDSNGTTVTGSIGGTALAPWDFPDPQNRADGYAGVTASTRSGQIAAYDNVEIRDAAGNVVFTDDFEVFHEPSSTGNWELFQ